MTLTLEQSYCLRCGSPSRAFEHGNDYVRGYHLANWFEGPKGGARARTNIAGMVCLRCGFALVADVEHTCGNLKGIEPLS